MLRVLHNGQEKDVTVELGELPQKESSISSNDHTQSTTSILEGVNVADLDDETRQAIQAPSSLKGAVITEIDPDSDAYRAGLRQGFVIEEIDRKPVRSAADVATLANNAKKDQPVLMRVWSGGQSRYFTLGGKQ